MAKNNEALKKHHFWILLALVPLLVMIAVITVSSSVGGAIDERVTSYTKAQTDIAGKLNPKSNKLIEEVEKQVGKVSDRKGDLWQTNWDRQKDMYIWPNSPVLKEIEKQKLKFGAPLPNDRDQFEEFKKAEVYLAEYSTAELKGKVPPGTQGMADSVAPTQFLGGWQSILRHVVSRGWGDRVLTPDQIWLLMEDIWVQRSMLSAVRSVNTEMSQFTRVRFEKDGVAIDDPTPGSGTENKLRRKFRSRIWEVELEVGRNEDNKPVLKGRLSNHTDRLQLMGLNNTMILRVWFQKPEDEKGNPRKDVRSWDFKIGGEFLAGAGATKPDGKTPADVLNIEPTRDHEIPATYQIDEIAKVEQVFDTRTVPIRRIDALALGYTDSRHAASQLFPPGFVKEDPAASGTGTTGGEGFGSGSGPPPGMVVAPGTGGAPGAAAGGPTGPGRGAGTLASVVEANKKRYLNNPKESLEVRRMPVAIVVVVDQAYLQDVQLAFANSPLRFQITQVTWARFRDRLAGDGSTGGGSSGDPSGGVVGVGAIGQGSGLGMGFGSGGGPPRPGGMGPRPPGGVGIPGPGVASPPGGMGTGGGAPPGFGSGGLTVSESQLTSGLIELSIYGIVSLYEKVPAPGETPPADPNAKKDGTDAKDPGTAKKDSTDPKESGMEKKEPSDPKETGNEKKDPKEKGTGGKEPMPPEEKKSSKMRRPLRRPR